MDVIYHRLIGNNNADNIYQLLCYIFNILTIYIYCIEFDISFVVMLFLFEPETLKGFNLLCVKVIKHNINF